MAHSAMCEQQGGARVLRERCTEVSAFGEPSTYYAGLAQLLLTA
jgi:hypothetical protein